MTEATVNGIPVNDAVRANITKVRDSLTNLITGMGTARDKTAATRFNFVPLDIAQQEAAYRGDWIARKVVDIPAYDATREGRNWQADRADITALETAEKNLNLMNKLQTAMIKARLYGGGALVMGVDGTGDNSTPLDLNMVKKDSLRFVHAISRNEIASGPIERDLGSPWYGEPQYYDRTAANTSSMRIHPSRVVRLVGMPLPDPDRSGVGDGWGDSMLQIVHDAIVGAGLVISSVASLVQENKLDVISVPDLTASLSDPDYSNRLLERFALAGVAKSLHNMILLDKDEEWERINAQFTGMPDLLRMYLLIASGAADIPATRMLGQSPTGLSATGESDIRNYYDRVSTEQKTTIAPALSRIDEVMIRSVLGTRPADIFFEWNSLWQLTEKEKTEIAKSKSDVFKVDVDTGLIEPEILREARINQLIEDGTYPGLESILEDFEAQQEAGLLGEADLAPDPTDEPINTGVDIGNEMPLADAARILQRRHKRFGNSFKDEHGALHRRVSRLIADARPRTLYMRRDVVNADEIRAWAKSVGFETVQTDLHVTVAYSHTPVDWFKIGEDWTVGPNEEDRLVVKGGPRAIEEFNKGAIVLQFASTKLGWRHESIRERGASWDFPEYNPHITLTWNKPQGLDIAAIKPYNGQIVLGPEIFEEIKTDWVRHEDAKAGRGDIPFWW